MAVSLVLPASASAQTDRSLRADAFVTFQLNPDGTIDRVRMEPASPTVDFSYDFQDLDLEPKQEE
jgi:hypothetical protein